MISPSPGWFEFTKDLTEPWTLWLLGTRSHAANLPAARARKIHLAEHHPSLSFAGLRILRCRELCSARSSSLGFWVQYTGEQSSYKPHEEGFYVEHSNIVIESIVPKTDSVSLLRSGRLRELVGSLSHFELLGRRRNHFRKAVFFGK